MILYLDIFMIVPEDQVIILIYRLSEDVFFFHPRWETASHLGTSRARNVV
jgi:hypothetical protein